MLPLISLAAGTLLSEDLACVTAGLLIRRGEIHTASGIAACAIGIFVGDVGLWALGRAGNAAVLRRPSIARHLNPQRYETLRAWLSNHAGQAIVASRFLPGTRLPLYVVAGLTRIPGIQFAGWAAFATALWTPVLVSAVSIFGDAFISTVSPIIRSAWLANLGAALTIVGLLRTIRLATVGGRRA